MNSITKLAITTPTHLRNVAELAATTHTPTDHLISLAMTEFGRWRGPFDGHELTAAELHIAFVGYVRDWCNAMEEPVEPR